MFGFNDVEYRWCDRTGETVVYWRQFVVATVSWRNPCPIHTLVGEYLYAQVHVYDRYGRRWSFSQSDMAFAMIRSNIRNLTKGRPLTSAWGHGWEHCQTATNCWIPPIHETSRFHVAATPQ